MLGVPRDFFLVGEGVLFLLVLHVEEQIYVSSVDNFVVLLFILGIFLELCLDKR